MLAVIGGSGFTASQDIKLVDQIDVATPYGKPSSIIDILTVGGQKIALLRRHGNPATIPPHKVNYRANIYALKSLGVEQIIGTATVGSLKEDIKPLDIVIPDQGVDRTWGRESTYFDGGLIVHTGMADPFCPDIRDTFIQCAGALKIKVHNKSTYVCMQGPQFSTRGESEMHRKLGFDVIGMTLFPEAKLAREAEICYATIALVTDYDVWHEHEANVSEELLLANSRKLQAFAHQIIIEAVPLLATRERKCNCGNALSNAFGSDLSSLPADLKKRLDPLIGKYLNKGT